LSFITSKEANYLYLYGNTLHGDLLLNHDGIGTKKQDQLDVLLVGSGDLRNVLHTLTETNRKFGKQQQQQQQQHLSFVLNDYSKEVIARNSIILYALYTRFSSMKAAEFLLQFWYSLHLTQEVYNFWVQIIQECIDKMKSSSSLCLLEEREGQVEDAIVFY
jgi:hypothetical protein